MVDVQVNSYSSVNVPRAIPDLSSITSTITVPDAFSILDVDVQLNISHTNDADLDVYLIGPDGTRVLLFADVGGTGDNFNGTILDDEVSTLISTGTAPFAGRFRPQSPLSAFDGKTAAGVWTLEITDDLRKDKGTLNSWSIQVAQAVTLPAPASLALKSSGSSQGTGITAFNSLALAAGSGQATSTVNTATAPAAPAATPTKSLGLTPAAVDHVFGPTAFNHTTAAQNTIISDSLANFFARL